MFKNPITKKTSVRVNTGTIAYYTDEIKKLKGELTIITDLNTRLLKKMDKIDADRKKLREENKGLRRALELYMDVNTNSSNTPIEDTLEDLQDQLQDFMSRLSDHIPSNN